LRETPRRRPKGRRFVDANFRAQVQAEHQATSKLLDQYLAALRDAYSAELKLSTPPS
jgi:hypothetical protein